MQADMLTLLHEGVVEHAKQKIPRVIGIHGYMHSGKDTVATMLKNTLVSKYKFKEEEIEIYSFADPIKKILIEYFGLTHDDVYTQEGKIRFNNDFGMLVRQILQKFGTEAMRNKLHRAVWTIAMKYKIEKSKAKVIIIPDVRFLNEFKFIKSQNGMIGHVIRTAVDPIENMSLFKFILYKLGIYRLHESETPVDTKGFRVYPIINNTTLEDLKMEVDSFIYHMVYLKGVLDE